VSQVFCQGREKSNPVLIGSVKTNVGHLEATSGVAGVVSEDNRKYITQVSGMCVKLLMLEV